MIKRLLNRREFNGLCVTLGSSLGAAAGMLGGTAGTWAMEIDSWHRFDPRKANSKVPRRHRRPGIGPGLCTTRTGKTFGNG